MNVMPLQKSEIRRDRLLRNCKMSRFYVGVSLLMRGLLIPQRASAGWRWRLDLPVNERQEAAKRVCRACSEPPPIFTLSNKVKTNGSQSASYF